MKHSFQVFSIILISWTIAVESKSRPHIIFIYVDDLGWGDVSFHGSPEIPTPNYDALAMSGIVLNNYYGQWLCTPSRGALLTGKYPIRLGFQHSVIFPGEKSGLHLNEVTFPQYFKKLGYSNHMIGKWHLGYMTKEYLPTSRGFDSFFGFLNGVLDYYDYTFYEQTLLKSTPHFHGIDLYNNTDLIRNFRGPYATDVFTDKAIELIRKHNLSEPMFLYLSHLAVHGNSIFKPIAVPIKYMERVMYIPDVERRVHAARTVALDDSVGKVFKALNDKGMLENSIVLVVSDNGAESRGGYGGGSSNYPLRGTKRTMWEGGNRVPSVIWSPLLNLQEPIISKQLMSVVDWLPTLYRAAGGDPKDIQNIDGIDMWETLKTNSPSRRKELLYNIDPIEEVSAYRIGDLKVINGSNSYNDWFNQQTLNCYNTDPISSSCDFVEKSIVRDILLKKGMWMLHEPNQWRKNVAIACRPHPRKSEDECKYKPCLFDLVKDPCEHNNIADNYTEVVNTLMNRIYDYHRQAVKPQHKPSDPRANPECHDFAFVPWLDPEHYNECQYYS